MSKSNLFGGRNAALAAVCLAVFASSRVAQASTFHYDGGPTGVLEWGYAPYWFEDAVPTYAVTDTAIVNELPYDDNWVFGAGAGNITILRGNWKFGANQVYVSNDLVVGDFQNPEQISGYHNAYMTFDWDSSHYANGYAPGQYTGDMIVNGNTIVGKSAGSDGYLSILGCGTNPTLTTPNVFVGVYGNGTMNLQNAAVKYTNLYIGDGAGSNGTFIGDGRPIEGYNQSLKPEFVGLNNAIPNVEIGVQGNGTMTLKNGANTAGQSDSNGNLLSSMGTVMLGVLSGSAGTFNVQSGSTAYAFSMNVGVAGQGALNVDAATLTIAPTYSTRNVDNNGSLVVQGQAGAISSVDVSHFGLLRVKDTIRLGTFSTLDVTGGATVNTTYSTSDGGQVRVSGDGSRFNAVQSLVGQPGGTNFSSFTVQDDGTATGNYLKTGENGLVSVFTGGTISIGNVNDVTQPGHIQVGPGGVLGGRGLFQADVDNNGGTIDPGFSPGEMHVQGNFNMSDGTTVIELGGFAPGSQYDVLDVTGNLNITGGTIDFESYNGWVAPAGTAFSFFHAGGLNIGSGVTILNDTGTNLVFNPATGSALVNPVPEPASFLILGLGATGLIRRRAVNRAR